MGNEDLAQILQNEGRVKFDRERFHYLRDLLEDSWGHKAASRRAAALVLSEQGFSSSGISNLIDINEDTCSDYLDDICDKFGENAVETHPQSEPIDELWNNGYQNPFSK